VTRPPDQGFFDALGAARRYDGSYHNPLTQLGNSSVDKGAAGYASWRPPFSQQPEQLMRMYRTWGYVRRAVDVLPDMATRRGWRIDTDGARDVAADLDRRLRTVDRIRSVCRMGRLWGGAVVLMVGDGEDLGTPLRVGGALSALQVFDGREARVGQWDDDLASPNYRRAGSWNITPYGSGVQSSLFGVHHTRCLYAGGHEAPPSYAYDLSGHDLSVMEAYFDAIRDKVSMDRSAVGLAQQMRVWALRIAGLSNAMSSQQRDSIRGRVNTFFRQLSSIGGAAIAEGDDLIQHNLSASGYADLDATARRAMAAVEGIPQSVLFGDPPSGLNTDGAAARQQMAQVVASYQRDVLEPILMRLYQVALAGEGVDTTGLRVVFHPLEEPSAKEQAEVRAIHAQTDASYIASGVLMADEARERFVGSEYSDELTVDDDPLDLDDDVAALAEVAASRADAKSHKVPEAARNNARRVLRWREEHGDEVKGMTDVGWRRARQLAESDRVGGDTVSAMAGFARHRRNYEKARAKSPDKPWTEPAIVAWLGWGGTTGVDWARGITGADED